MRSEHGAAPLRQDCPWVPPEARPADSLPSIRRPPTRAPRRTSRDSCLRPSRPVTRSPRSRSAQTRESRPRTPDEGRPHARPDRPSYLHRRVMVTLPGHPPRSPPAPRPRPRTGSPAVEARRSSLPSRAPSAQPDGHLPPLVDAPRLWRRPREWATPCVPRVAPSGHPAPLAPTGARSVMAGNMAGPVTSLRHERILQVGRPMPHRRSANLSRQAAPLWHAADQDTRQVHPSKRHGPKG